MRSHFAVLALCCAVALAAALHLPCHAQAVQGNSDAKTATVKDAYGNRVGYVQPSSSGPAIVKDNYGNRTGYIEPSGVIKDNYGNRRGYITKP